MSREVGRVAGGDGWEVTIVDLRMGGGEYERALGVLSEQERARAGRIGSEVRRRRFVAARAAVRERLGMELGVPAERVELRRGVGGKPELESSHAVEEGNLSRGRASREQLRFNVSHSENLAAIAIGRGGEVGVDGERVRGERRGDARRVDWERLLARICGEGEREEARWEAGRVSARIAFHERWVAKEAVVKALGQGLRIAPARVVLGRVAGRLEVEELEGGEAGAPDGAFGVPARCTLVPVAAPAGFLGALALADWKGRGDGIETNHPSIPATCLQGDPTGLAKGTIR